MRKPNYSPFQRVLLLLILSWSHIYEDWIDRFCNHLFCVLDSCHLLYHPIWTEQSGLWCKRETFIKIINVWPFQSKLVNLLNSFKQFRWLIYSTSLGWSRSSIRHLCNISKSYSIILSIYENLLKNVSTFPQFRTLINQLSSTIFWVIIFYTSIFSPIGNYTINNINFYS